MVNIIWKNNKGVQGYNSKVYTWHVQSQFSFYMDPWAPLGVTWQAHNSNLRAAGSSSAVLKTTMLARVLNY